MMEILNFIFKYIICIYKFFKLPFETKKYKEYILYTLKYIQHYDISEIKFSYECHGITVDKIQTVNFVGNINDALFEGSIYAVSKQYQLIDKEREILTKILTDNNFNLIYEQYNSQDKMKQFYFIVRDHNGDIEYKRSANRNVKHININRISNLKKRYFLKNGINISKNN